MQRKGIVEDAAMQRHLLEHSDPLEAHHLALIDATEQQFADRAYLQVPPEQALALRMLTRMSRARRALEIGTFTGLSAMLIAEGLGPNGHLVCLDVDQETTTLARRHWEEAGLGERIELRLGPAEETLESLGEERFDLVFIDADKPGYVAYFEAALPMIDSGDFIIADNTLRRNTVADPSQTDDTTEAIRRFNRHVAQHAEVDVVVIPAYDGVTIIRKR